MNRNIFMTITGTMINDVVLFQKNLSNKSLSDLEVDYQCDLYNSGLPEDKQIDMLNYEFIYISNCLLQDRLKNSKLKEGLENYQLSNMAATLIDWHDEFLQKEADYSKSFYDDAQDFLNKKFDEHFLNKRKSKLKCNGMTKVPIKLKLVLFYL